MRIPKRVYMLDHKVSHKFIDRTHGLPAASGTGGHGRIRMRLAIHDDVDEIVALGAKMHAESPRFSKFPYNEAKLATLAHHLIGWKDGLILVCEDELHTIVGMYVGVVSDHYFSDARYATDLLLYVDPKHRGGLCAVRMIRAFAEWAKGRGALEIAPGCSTEVEPQKVRKLYEALGFRTAGYLFIQDV